MNRLLCALLVWVTALLLLGILMLDSASVQKAVPHRFYAHLLWLSTGLACGLVAALVDYRKLRHFHLPWVFLGLAILLLVVVLIPGVGVHINGARRWLPFGGQPSEPAKLGLMIWLANYGVAHEGRMWEQRDGFVYPALVCGLTAGLVFLEPDWGTAVLLGTVSLAMLLLAGARWRYIIGVSVTAVPVFILLVLFNPVRRWRFLSFTDPEKYQDGIGWQGWHSVLSIGLGGIWGTLCGEGTHKYGFVPEQQTDFIFSLIGEELGLIGTTAVVLLFASIILCGTRIAWRITDPFGQLLASGLSILIGLQAFINIGVCTSSLPNKGIPLPFVSYGGSSLVCMLVAVGLLVSIGRHAPLAPVYPDVKRAPRGVSPFAAPAGYPRAQSATDLASVLLRRERTAWSRVVSWARKLRASRHPKPPLHAYQRLPSKHGPFLTS
jgi:cell division protein FtsW